MTRTITKQILATAAGAAALILAAGPAHAVPTDLSTWQEDGSGNWVVAGDNNSVNQTVNGNPAVFYGDFAGHGIALSGTVRVTTTGDDDFFGFVLGYNPGDLGAAATDFLVIDWKQGAQSAFGCSGAKGLAISHASAGLGNNSGAWCHSGAGVTQLQRGATLGSTGWLDNTTYGFDIEFTATKVKVFVNGGLELDVDGTFSNGRFGFYNYSQAGVTYAAIEQEVLPPPPPPPPSGVPEPATWAMLIVGFGFTGSMVRRSRRKLAYAV